MYNLVKAKYPGTTVKGKDLFDAALFNNPETLKVFYTFMGELKEMVNAATVTPTHRFIKNLETKNRLLRCYTQNIDGMEARLGMSSALGRAENTVTSSVVHLHGDLDTLKCTLCKCKYGFSSTDVDCFRGGSAPPCPNCVETDGIRTALGGRAITVGVLRPNIVLYNEDHEFGEMIAKLTTHDINKKPDLLIVMGTSLKVHGIKHLVKDLANAVHGIERGKVILVNRVDLAASEWDHIFDYHIKSDADDAVLALETLVNDLEVRAAKNDVARQTSQANKPRQSHANSKENYVRTSCWRRLLIKYDHWWCSLLAAPTEKEKKEILSQNARPLTDRLRRFAEKYLAPENATDRNACIEENIRHMIACKKCNTLSKLLENRVKTNGKHKNPVYD